MKVWIANKDYADVKKGDVVMKAILWTSWQKSFCDEFEVGDMDSEFLLISTDSEGNPVFSEDATAKLAKELERKTLALYNTMTILVTNAMKDTFGTTKSDSALANELTWKEMVNDGTGYELIGLKSDMAFAEFEIGASLDTRAKVERYAAEKVTQTKAYAIYRLKVINDFRVRRAALKLQYGL